MTLFDPMNCTHQAPLSTEFSRQEYWGGLPFSSPGDLPDWGIKPMSPMSPTLQADSLPTETSGKTFMTVNDLMNWKTVICILCSMILPVRRNKVLRMINCPLKLWVYLILSQKAIGLNFLDWGMFSNRKSYILTFLKKEGYFFFFLSFSFSFFFFFLALCYDWSTKTLDFLFLWWEFH